MRIVELDLLRWGAFENRRIDLSAGDPGLHVVVGANEAGKSTTLRAVTNLLFDIQDPDRDGRDPHLDRPRAFSFSWRFPMPKLRLRGVIVGDDGTRLAFRRRKGRKDTLLVDADDEAPMPEAELARFLGAVDREAFRQLFCLDHVRLREGGAALLENRGEAGAALYGASVGGASVRRRLAGLAAERDDILAPSGRKGRLLELLKDEARLEGELRAAQVSPETFRAAAREAEAARAALDELDAEERRRAARLEAIERRTRARPHLLALRRVEDELAALPPGVVLPEDFGRRLAELRLKRDATRAEVEESRKLVARRREALAAIAVDDDLVARAGRLAALHARLSAYGEAREALRETRAQRDARTAELEALEADLESGIATPPSAEARRELARLDAEARELRARLERAAAADRDDRARGAEIRRGLPRGVEVAADAPLRALLDDDEAAGDPDGDAALPGADTLRRHEQALLAAETALRDARRAQEGIEAELVEARADLDDVRREGEAPTEDELERARAGRDARWAEVRAAWLDGAAALPSPHELARAYERAREHADALADRLRREADRVRRRLDREGALRRGEERRARAAATVAEARRADEAAREAWRAVWAPLGVTPLTPVETRPWRDAVLALRELAAKRAERAREIARLDADLEAAAAGRAAALTAAGLPPELDEEAVAARLEVLDRRAGLLARRDELVRRIAAHEQTVAEFERDARAACPAATDDDATPPDVRVERAMKAARAAEQAAARFEAAGAALREEEERLERRQAQLAGLDAAFEGLCAEAGADEDGVDARWRTSHARRDLEERQRQLELLLDEAARGRATRDELATSCAEASPEDDAAEAAALSSEGRAMRARRDAAHEERVRLEARVAAMDAGGTAAGLAADLELVRSEIADLARRFRVLTAADRMLERELERLRVDSAPLVTRAGALFARLTGGAYVGLGLEFGEKDRPHLLGLRDDEAGVGVEAMSDGTRDQLYLALVVAVLEARLERGERLPFVLDDVLIHFDDRRAAAALEVLAELGARTQVLLFTHHERIAELAAGTAGPAGVSVLRLDEPRVAGA